MKTMAKAVGVLLAVACLAGDFEGRVRFGIGVAGRDGFRVVEQHAPTRVAVDVR
jgi:hypothetical protein